jgi:hypothetical protein
MATRTIAPPVRRLTLAASLAWSGCATSGSTPEPPRSSSDVSSASRSAPSNASPTATPRANAPVRTHSTEPALDPDVEVVELEIEGTHTKQPMLPCRLLITHHDGSMVLDFHAEPSSAERIRQQTEQLGVYLNENRDDEEASRAPGGRPDPATFPVRQILAARPTASVEYLPDGARLTLVPDPRARTGRLRAEVLWYAGDLLPGLPLEGKTCPELPARPLAAAAESEAP